MIPPPLNNTLDEKPPRPSIAGHNFDPVTDRCSCSKSFAEIACAPYAAIGDVTQAELWNHGPGSLNLVEWLEISAEKERIFACARS